MADVDAFLRGIGTQRKRVWIPQKQATRKESVCGVGTTLLPVIGQPDAIGGHVIRVLIAVVSENLLGNK